MLVNTTLALGFAWVARNAIVRLLADVRAQQLGAIMETIADLADEVDRERDHIPRSVDAPVTLLKYGDWECPCAPPRPPSVPPQTARVLGHARPAARPPGRTRAPRPRQANAAQLALDADQFERGPARAPLRRAGRRGRA